MSRTRALGRYATAFSVLPGAILAVVSGCGLTAALGKGGQDGRDISFFPSCISCPSLLDVFAASLTGALDEAPDEVFRILRPPAPPEPVEEKVTPEEEAARPAPTSRFRVGLRGGMLSFDGADVRWTDAVQYGLYLRRVPAEPRRMTFEVALGYAETERPDEFRSSALYTLHGDLIFGRAGGEGVALCLLVGGAAVLEESTNRASGETASGRGAGAEAGLSLGAAGGRWELRGLYTQVLATANANSLVSFTFGIAF